MENLTRQLDSAGSGDFVFRQPLPEHVALQMVSVRDVGVVAAALLVDARALDNDEIEIAGDQLTGPQIASRITHRRSPGALRPVRGAASHGHHRR